MPHSRTTRLSGRTGDPSHSAFGRLRLALFSALALVVFSGCKRTIKQKGKVTHYPGTGGVVLEGVGAPPKGICLAPPALSATTSTTSSTQTANANIVDVADISASSAVEYAEALHRLYENTERSLFLQFALYRLCEAHLNNMLQGTPATGAPSVRQDCKPERAVADTSMTFVGKVSAGLATARTRMETAWQNTQVPIQAALRAEAAAKAAEKKAEAAEAQASKKPNDAKLRTAATQARTAASAARNNATSKRTAANHLVAIAKRAELEWKGMSDGSTAALELASYDRKQYAECRKNLGRDTYERKFSHVLEAAVDLYEVEADVAKATAVAETAKAEQEKAKAQAQALKSKSDEAKAKLEALEKAALESVLKQPKKEGSSTK